MDVVIKRWYSPIFPNASSADWISFSPSSTESVHTCQKFMFLKISFGLPVEHVYHLSSFFSLHIRDEIHLAYKGINKRQTNKWTWCCARDLSQEESKLLTVVGNGLASFSSYLLHHLISSCRTLSTPFHICPKVIHFIATIRKRLAIMGRVLQFSATD